MIGITRRTAPQARPFWQWVEKASAFEPASSIRALGCPHYRPGQWTPHLAIAMAIPANRREGALALAAGSFDLFSLVFDAVECVSWPPVRVVETAQLGG